MGIYDVISLFQSSVLCLSVCPSACSSVWLFVPFSLSLSLSQTLTLIIIMVHVFTTEALSKTQLLLFESVIHISFNGENPAKA